MNIDFKSRIESAAKILDPYFKEAHIEDSEKFLEEVLLKMGVDDSQIGIEILTSNNTSISDFENAIKKCNIFLAESNINEIPSPRLKFAWSCLSKQKEEKQSKVYEDSIQTIVKTLKPIGQWSDIELLEAYNKDAQIDIEEQLKIRSRGRYCIIFFDDNTVDAENSLYMLRKARYQDTPSTFMISNVMKQVFKVGEFPLDVFFECPIHNNVLLIDGYCEECGMVYNTINIERLIFIRLIKENTTIEPRLFRDFDLDKLFKEYPKIAIKFKELKEEDKLPSLKRRVSKSRETDPFRVSSHRTF